MGKKRDFDGDTMVVMWSSGLGFASMDVTAADVVGVGMAVAVDDIVARYEETIDVATVLYGAIAVYDMA